MCEVMRRYEDAAWKRGVAEGEARGEARGKAAGMQQGMQQGRFATAASMLQNGISPEMAAKCSSLPLSQVLQLMKN